MRERKGVGHNDWTNYFLHRFCMCIMGCTIENCDCIYSHVSIRTAFAIYLHFCWAVCICFFFNFGDLSKEYIVVSYSRYTQKCQNVNSGKASD